MRFNIFIKVLLFSSLFLYFISTIHCNQLLCVWIIASPHILFAMTVPNVPNVQHRSYYFVVFSIKFIEKMWYEFIPQTSNLYFSVRLKVFPFTTHLVFRTKDSIELLVCIIWTTFDRGLLPLYTQQWNNFFLNLERKKITI
jgi:hypothetical protein